MLIALKLLGSIALLIFGMKMMSEALQKMAGPQLRHLLGAMTTNRLSGVATGALVTVAVQSSAATTVMTVSFVNAALLSLTQAISVIMGANIGTTMSAWIMSAGFSFNIVNVVWPAFLIGIILIQIGKHRYLGDFLFGLSFLLFSLGMLKATGVEMDLASKPAVVDFFASFKTNYGTILLFLLIGTILTAIVQSSAALMAITMVLCATGAISIYQGIALVMGENIGTTVTANLAALSANTQARRTAMAHLLFNVFGVIWVLILFFPFVRMVCGIVGMDPQASGQNPTQLSFALATFHSCFNLINTAILIWFIPQIEKLVCLLIKPKKTEEEDEFRLQYIRGGIMKTPEISVLQAQKEIALFGENTQRMFAQVKELYSTKDEQSFTRLFERIHKGEEGSDRMENQIGRYLGDVGDAHLSDETKEKIRSMLRQIGELESVGDSCFNLARILRRKRENKIDFTPQMEEGLQRMFSLVEDALTRMNDVLSGRKEDYGISESEDIERRINACRNALKRQNIDNLDAHLYDYDKGTVYADLIGECDNTGDNISVKNPNYCELTGLYWAWKNLNCEYLGLAHYRRHFTVRRGSKDRRDVLALDQARSLLSGVDVILPKKRNYWIETNYKQYIHAHHAIDLDETRRILEERYPEYLPVYEAYMKRTKGHRFNMFVMKKELADRYCEWLFDILFELEKRLDISAYSDNDKRVFGFVAERLLDVWLETNKIQSKDVPYMFLEKENWIVKGFRFLSRKIKAKKQ